MSSSTLEFASHLVEKAKRAGAKAADVIAVESAMVSVSLRLSKPEQIERAESKGFGLRVLMGKRQAMVSSTDWSEEAAAMMIERAIAMANASPEDPFIGLADQTLLAKDIPDLQLYDSAEPDAEWLIEQATKAEAAALAVKGITNSEGADASYSSNTIALVASNGFAHTYRSSNLGISASVVAGEGTAMERDYDYCSARFREDLTAPETIGRTAGEKAVKRLSPRKVATGKVPIVFDPQVAKSLLGNLSAAINGAAVARGTSFLKHHLGKAIFPQSIQVEDDPHRIRGLASKPFDGEGVAGKKRRLVENGVLTSWLLDIRSANQLGLTTTGHAMRGFASAPMPSSSNLYMLPGKDSPQQLIAGVKNGFYITELFGMGVNLITGDYSQGASGFWIENGEIAYPVSEVTIAGHLLEIFAHITPANDLVFKYGTNTPTLLIESMTVAGS